MSKTILWGMRILLFIKYRANEFDIVYIFYINEAKQAGCFGKIQIFLCICLCAYPLCYQILSGDFKKPLFDFEDREKKNVNCKFHR